MGIEYELKQDDLAACPFCGSINQDTSSNGMESHFVVCQDCGAEGPAKNTEQEAITAWFTRATLPSNGGLGMIVQERGPWKAGETEDKDRAFVASDDFTHDVRLYVNGDFGTKADRLEYAKEIAKRLNAYRPPYEAHSCDVPGCAVCDPCHGL